MLRHPILPAILLITGCSIPLTQNFQAKGPEQEPPAPAVVPASAISVTPAVVASPMYVWVPQWGVYVVEGHDIVYYEGYYYYWYGGRWYVSRTHRGPWSHITEQPPALANLPAGQFNRHLPAGLEKKSRPQPNPAD